MYMTLKPIEAVREEELSRLAAPWCAISWLKSAHSGYCRIQGFNDLWEACILEQDSHHDHWNHRTHGFERLCAKINQGDWVVVLDKSWPPLAPAYAQVNGHWQPTRHVWDPEARRRLESQGQTIQRAQREEETFQSRNRPPTPEQIESASGPGNRAMTLGPHVGGVEQINVVNREAAAVGETAGSIRNVNPGYPTPGRTQNCINCTVATDATLSGNPAVALPSNGPVSIRVLERQYSGSFSPANTAGGIEKIMLDTGSGSRGIVFGYRGPNEAGHVFNTVNQNGVVRFLDGQTGKPATFNDYQSLHLLRTN